MSNEVDPPVADDSKTEFGLTAPGDFGHDANTMVPDEAEEKPKAKTPTTPRDGGGKDDDQFGGGGGPWKGFEEEEVDPDPGVDFGQGKSIPEDELDMTPMVDVTFLLLIFFMVTASFTLRKSFEQAHSQVDDPSNQVVEPKDDEDDFVEVIIDQTNTFYIRTRDTEEIEAPSDREMRDVLREAKEIAGAKRLIIRAHVDALHGKVVKVLDTGNSIGMERIETIVSEVDF
ncbi:MAG: biopolymer transporter ExbD [Planctomycetota bacterium]